MHRTYNLSYLGSKLAFRTKLHTKNYGIFCFLLTLSLNNWKNKEYLSNILINSDNILPILCNSKKKLDTNPLFFQLLRVKVSKKHEISIIFGV